MKRRFVIKRLLIVWDANEVQITFLGPAPGLKPSRPAEAATDASVAAVAAKATATGQS